MLTADEIKRIINRENASPQKTLARIGQRYYRGHHDIENYRLFYYDADGQLVEDKTRSNIKISHPFFMELVDQCVQYMLSGKEGYMFSDLPELQLLLDDQFNNNDDFNAELNDLLSGTNIKGWEYMYVYADVDGRLAFEVADSLGIAEVRAKDTQDNCDYLVRWYIERIDKDNQTIKKIEVWDKNQTTFFIEEGENGIKLDTNVAINPRPHLLFKEEAELYGKSFGYIPFFRLDNNNERLSSIAPVKSIIDDYDLMSCSLSNNLQDMTEGIYVVKGFAGDSMDELMQNLKTKKAVGVSEEGDIDIRTVQIPYEARKAKMEMDRENIYKFGMGFDSSKVGDGNVTNVVIKSRYTLLDLKCNKLEIKMKQFLKKLVKVFLKKINEEQETDYDVNDVYIRFQRETISNDVDNANIEFIDAQKEQVKINTLLNTNGILDGDTVLKQVCNTLELDYDEVKKLSTTITPEDEIDDALDDLEGADVTGGAEEALGHALNGAQTASLLSIIAQFKAGTLSENQAVNVLSVAIGISKEKARELIQEN